MRFLLSWIVIVGLSHFARGDPVTAAYELMQDGPYSGDPGSTIPAEYNYNGATIPWQRVYTADQLSNWQSFSCHRDLWKDQKLVTCPLSFSDPLPLNFTTLDEGRTQAVYVSPTGMVALTMNHVLAPPQGFIPEDPLRWPMYYMFTSPVWGPLFLWGFNEDVLWDVTVDSFRFANLYSNLTGASIFLLEGQLKSHPNSTHPDRATAIDFQLQLHERTWDIVLHIRSLQNATFNDLRNPLSIGIAQAGAASMWLNNDFPPEKELTATLWWQTYENILDCQLHGSNCATCTQANPSCSWCRGTASCVGSPSACPSSTPSEFTCLPSDFLYCEDCALAGFRWCTGEATCSYSGSNVTLLQTCPGYSYQAGGPFGCFPLNSTCGSTDCAAYYSTPSQEAHMQCAVFDYFDSNNAAIGCRCEVGWTGEIMRGGCSTCDTANGYYIDDTGACTTCPSISPAALVGLFFAAAVVTYLLVKLNSLVLVRKLLVPIQNAIVFFQVVTLLALVDLSWPFAVKRAISIFAIVGLQLLKIPSVECFLSYDQTLYITMAAPLVIGAFLVLSALVVSPVYHLQARCCRRPVGSDPLADLGVGEPIVDAATKIRRSRIVFARAFISFLILFYSHLSTELLGAYWHIDFWAALVTSDSRQVNLHERAKFWMVLLSTIVYLLGIPVAFFFMVFPRLGPFNCGCCTLQIRHSEYLEPLISKYRPGLSQYFECLVVPTWKVAINALIIFAPRDTKIGLISALLVVLILIYAFYQPYAEQIENREQKYLMGGALVVLMAGVMFYIAGEGDETSAKLVLKVISYIVIFLTLASMVLVIVYTLYSIIRAHKSDVSDSLTDPVYDDDNASSGDYHAGLRSRGNSGEFSRELSVLSKEAQERNRADERGFVDSSHTSSDEM